MEVYYAGFNGFKQVPGSSGSDTLTCLTLHSKASKVIDAAICWNYMVVAEPEGITKYGLINNRPGQANLERPPGAATVCQVSGTPRHILCVTDSGECWTHEEGKGWRRVVVVQTDARDESTVCSEETVSTLAEEDEELREPDTTSQAESHPLNIDDGGKEEEEEEEGEGPGNEESPVCMSRTACGDFHNLACDTAGQAYSLPSPITFSSFPGGAQQRVVDVACGKEHCMLLTEHGQVLHSTRE
jgi:alpha-tubulin suppressor-like RCC1 family protein